MSNQVVDRDQRLRALDPLASFCVTAPAGSGKTELLIQRFLTLLARVEQPEEVLAVTFTRKAAAEMRARIISALDKAGNEACPQDDHSAHTWQLASAVLKVDQQRNWNLSDNPGRFNIRTIDGFCASLTRQMPVLSSFGGAIAPTDNAQAIYQQATRALLDVFAGESDYADDLHQLLLHFDGNWQQLEQALLRMLTTREQWLVHMGGTGLTRETAQQVLDHSVSLLINDCLTETQAALGSFRGELHELLCYTQQQLGQGDDIDWPSLDDAQAWQPLANMLLTKDGQWRKRVDKRLGFPPSDDESKARKEQHKALVSEMSGRHAIRGLLEQVQHLPRRSPDDKHWQIVLAVSRILPLLAAQLKVVFQQQGVVDHTEISIAALAALGSDERPTELARKLDYQLSHILVDEFQDTAVNQFELIRRLTRGWAEENQIQTENPRTLFIVGDAMQSIYGFRDADVGLFVRAREHGFDELRLESLVLQSNFRSDATLVEWANNSFAHAFPSQDNVSRGEVTFAPAQAQRDAAHSDAVNLAAFDKDADGRLQEAAWMAQRIEQGMSASDCKSIAVLVRTRSQLLPLIEELKRRRIPWQAQDIDSLADSLAVRDLMSLCRALHNLADSVAWMSLLRAPWCGMSLQDLHALACHAHSNSSNPVIWQALQELPKEIGLSPQGRTRIIQLVTVLEKALQWRDQLGLRRCLEACWLALGGPACLATEAELADVEAFLVLLEDQDNRGEAYDQSALEQAAASLYAAPGTTSTKLQLMTLHKSKGLEFDWVFIPALERQPASDNRELLLWDDYHSAASGQFGFLLAMDDLSQEQEPTLYNYLHRQRRYKREQETTRLLYVGVTRAAKRLFLSASLAREETEAAAEDAGTEASASMSSGWEAPSSRSLLSRLWAVFSQQADSPHISLPEVEQGEAATPLARLAQLPPLGEDKINSEGGGGVMLPVSTDRELPRHSGNLIHLTLQRLSLSPLPAAAAMDWADLRRWWAGCLQSEQLSKEERTVVMQRAENAIANVVCDERGRWILSQQRTGAASEYALSIVGPEEEVVDYIIDRTYIEDNERWVVDYKSSMPDCSQSLEEFENQESKRYREQLENYRRAFQALDSLPVRTALYFPAIAHWLEVPAQETEQ